MASQEIYLSSICERLAVEKLQHRVVSNQDIPADTMLHRASDFCHRSLRLPKQLDEEMKLDLSTSHQILKVNICPDDAALTGILTGIL